MLGYGYPSTFPSTDEFHAFVDEEFGQRLQDCVYLDHAGATLASRSQLAAVHRSLCADLLANPHSASAAGRAVAERIERARAQVLAHFGVDAQSHALVFTSGATGALQLLGEMCPWATGAMSSASSSSSTRSQRGCELVMLDDNHTSVLGLRETAIGGGAARVRVVDGALRHVAEIYSRHSTDTDYIGASKEPALPVPSAPLSAPASEAVSSILCPNQRFVGLFVLPAESNFSGVRYDLDLVHRVHAGALDDIDTSSDAAFASASSLNRVDLPSIRDHRSRSSHGGRWLVALDASKFAGTDALDLRRVRADFVTVSFYKMFGHPTGLGALIVRRDALPTLALATGSPCSRASGASASDHGGLHFPAHSSSSSSYFGGGTVQVIDAHSRFHVARAGFAERFERGTPNTAAILALAHGFDALRRVGGMASIAAHCAALSAYTARALQRLTHGNGRRVFVLFGNHCMEDSPADHANNSNSDQCGSLSSVPQPQPPPGSSGQGPVIAFGLLRADGITPVGFAEVEALAAHAANARGGIHLRTGCLCNPGACQRHLALDGATVRRHWAAGRVCGDAKDVLDGRATGAIRISFGYMSTQADADAFLQFVVKYFVADNAAAAVDLASSITSSFARPLSTAIAALPALDTPESKSSPLTTTVAPTNIGAAIIVDADTNANANPISGAGADIINADPFADSNTDSDSNVHDAIRISALCVYPVKSCGVIRALEWPLGPRGLLFDREWSIVDPNGVALSQKRYPHMCRIQPSIDFRARTLTLTLLGADALVDDHAAAETTVSERPDANAALPLAATAASLTITLDEDASDTYDDDIHADNIPSSSSSSSTKTLSVCGVACLASFHSYGGVDGVVARWLTEALGVPCSLARIAAPASAVAASAPAAAAVVAHAVESASAPPFASSEATFRVTESEHAPLSFANEGQFLLVSAASFDAIRDAHARVRGAELNPAEFDDDVVSIDRFRPNIVVAGRQLAPFAEDAWSRLSIVSSAPMQSESGPHVPTFSSLASVSDSTSSSSSSSAPAPCEFAVEGPCTRCVMVNVDQRTGARRSLLFKTLATCRRGQDHQRSVPRSAAAPSQPVVADAAAAATAESNQSSSLPSSSSAAAAPSGRITFGALLALRPSASITKTAAADRAMRFLRVGDTVLPSSV